MDLKSEATDTEMVSIIFILSLISELIFFFYQCIFSSDSLQFVLYFSSDFVGKSI